MSKEQQQTYWRSLNELAQNEEYRKFAEREFPENATELTDGVSRRNFLQIMGASVALAGLASCRKPVQKIMPYTRQPEHLVPGKPLFYATAVPFKGNLTGIVVETHEGRPTKIEGNDLHPESKGRTNSRMQAAILDMYDQDRSRKIRQDGSDRSWDDFVSFCNDHFSDTDRSIAFISEASSSPSLLRLRGEALDKFPNARWVTFEPYNDESLLSGIHKAFGRRLRPLHHFGKSRITVSLNDDFMLDSDNDIVHIGDFAKSKAIPEDQNGKPSRLYVAESNYSLTGSNADHRLRIKSSEIPLFVFALAGKLADSLDDLEAFSGYGNEFSDHSWISVLAEELLAHQGNSILTAGSEHDPDVHATVAAINFALGNTGETIDYLEVPHLEEDDQNERFSELVGEMNAGNIDTVIMVGANPVFTAPSDLRFNDALEQVQNRLHLSLHYDETSRASDWHVNRAHFLETWGDGYSWSGARSVIQPLIQPLFDGKSEVEFLHAVVHGEDESGHSIVRKTWQEQFFTDAFESNWNRVLHDGLQQDTGFTPADVSLDANFSAEAAGFLAMPAEIPANAIELVLKPDPKLHDGRFANNGWLQELPDPMTKITWDNVALISPNTAERIGVPPERRFGDPEQQVISITDENGNQIEIAAWVLPGHADNSITVYTGYGREQIGRVADQVGVNTYSLRSSTYRLFIKDVDVSTVGRTYEIASTQDHHSLEGRPHVREASIDYYRENPTFAQDAVYTPGMKEGREHAVQLFSDKEFPDHEPQWGMTIDLNSCVGCGVCTIACQAENNIPVIGKREVRRGREMHWIRTDRYFNGDDTDNPKVVHQPVPCMHCDNAPCEQVCPVAATTHSDDGLNQMTYNRCIGTRYCSNNCPYKVRRFNFFNYSKEYLTSGDDPEIIQMAMNPDVTVRFRGVMEKCTYCVQRISRAKIDTKNETGDSIKPPDGTVVTACQQACPANAISFGDISDDQSKVSIEKRKDRNYMMLEELNVRARTTYLAKIRNPNDNQAVT
ncbi:TAT-variant-translocated molybdopterin oxidoreductase [Natronogracilivirga saccharolytica]|uniref:TAT-variant-translocated molybdopterin oxidoreductase n=1 Tax=Natronogracilivirga saccharolytica TaxID=2812953 RepID=A0A8J7RQB1_9BACT|nr:TAT-variant-translocated molybdopterin oxidoreductase [Natronogracilivirga saccharolytica]MBP3191067.1 TAT-variant-translocated molybdopterin oxidoreductase [Natronogracilivirga saccharolytica]